MTVSENNKRIARNTIYLYLRMIGIMGVTLFTSRIILDVLGIEDFGVYSLVNGFVLLLSFFFQNAMTSSTQRFIAYELGKGNSYRVKKIFSKTMTVNISISIIVLVLAETVGLWFVKNHLNIPLDRKFAAIWVYQFSILTFIVQLIRTPYIGSIIAYENMSLYAFISIIETVLKLLIVYTLLITNHDKLIVYGLLLFFVSLIITFGYKVYCCKKFTTCNYIFFWNKELYWRILSFSGWSMLSGIANMGSSQGGNIILNHFKGVAVNAAFGIANQVSYAIFAFSSSFQKAFYPQITKLYAVADQQNLKNLVFRASLLSYYLILIIAVPFIINAEIVLKIWLKEVPDHAVIFCQLMVIFQMIDAFQAPINFLIISTGNVKVYNIWLSSILFLNIPLSWYLLSIGKPPYYVFLIRVIINFVTAIIRTVYVKYFINFPSWEFLIKVVLKITPVTLIAFLTSMLLKNMFENDNKNFLIISVLSLVITCFLIYVLGINKKERVFINTMITGGFQKITTKKI